jgi:hypothetical protein
VALTVEDGTGIAGATSYVTLADARAYATARGSTLPDDDAAAEALLVRAMDYLEAQRRFYSGTKTYGVGFLQWPRTDATLDGEDLDSTAIPRELRDAQCQAAIDLQTVDPLAASKGPAVRRKTIGPITTEWAIGDDSQAAPARMPKVDALLAPLFRQGGFVFAERA